MPKVEVCECCKRPLAPRIAVGGKVKQRVFDFIANNAGVTTRQVMDAVYADDPDGGPDDLKNIAVQVCFINKVIAKQGLKIKSTRGPGATYSLVAL